MSEWCEDKKVTLGLVLSNQLAYAALESFVTQNIAGPTYFSDVLPYNISTNHF